MYFTQWISLLPFVMLTMIQVCSGLEEINGDKCRCEEGLNKDHIRNTASGMKAFLEKAEVLCSTLREHVRPHIIVCMASAILPSILSLGWVGLATWD